MPLYEYKAYDNLGKTVRGIIDAPSVATAHGKLKRQGFFPVDINVETGGHYKASVSTADMIFVLDQLSTLLKAGIPLPDALQSLTEQVSDPNLQRAFARIKVHLEEGESFAGALAAEQVFPPVLVKMIEAGESVGTVDLILERFTGFLERQSAFREKVVSSMIYPTIIFVASISLVFFILTYIAPTLVKVFSSFHQEMPLPTRILLGAGLMLKKNSLLIFVAIAAAVITWLRVLPRKLKDSLLLKMPFFGNMTLHIQISRWARTLSMLHGGGVNLMKALASSREVVENVVVSDELKLAEDYIRKGEGIGSAIARIPTIPPLVVQMTKTGEKSGELERLLNTAALFYEKEVEKKLNLFFKMLEPAIILFLGLVVGFVVIAALLPIFEINRMIK